MDTNSLIINPRVDSVLYSLMKIILIVTSALITLLVTFYVVIRYATPLNFDGFEEIIILLVVWLYFIGSANASREKSHIAADMLDLFIKSERKKQSLKFFSQLVGFIVLAIMLILSLDYMTFNMQYDTKTIIYRIPMYIYHGSMVLGFVLMLFYDTCHLIKTVRTLRQSKTLKVDESSESAKEEIL